MVARSAVQVILSCALAAWSLFFKHPKPPLSHEDVGVFMHLMMQPAPRDGNGVLIIGQTKGWIDVLRHEGFNAYGAADHEMWQMYYADIKDYGHLPWRTASFRIVVLLVELNRDVLFEMDRLLVPDGFVLIKVPDLYHSHFSYEMFLEYLHFKRYGMLFKTMVVWKKHGGFDTLQESA